MAEINWYYNNNNNNNNNNNFGNVCYIRFNPTRSIDFLTNNDLHLNTALVFLGIGLVVNIWLGFVAILWLGFIRKYLEWITMNRGEFMILSNIYDEVLC